MVVVFAVVAHDLRHFVRLGKPDDQAVGLDHPDSYTNGGMTSESSLEAVRRVEEAPLAELVSVTVDQVEAQMDRLLEPDTDSASLYRRWERSSGRSRTSTSPRTASTGKRCPAGFGT